MNSTTLQEAIVWMARSMGLNPTRDREEVIRYVNKYRNLLYNSFNRVQLFDDYEQCFTLTEFHQDCHGSTCTKYKGFTATLDMAGIMGAWESLQPVTLRSRWREVLHGKSSPRGTEVEIVPVNGTFATERDMTSAQQLKIYATSPNDAGKKVHITAKGVDGTEHRLLFTLDSDGQVTVNRIVCSIVRVALPPDLCGEVQLYQQDGTLLSTYPSGITVPQYRRYKVHDNYTCGSNTILIQSARTFVPISDDYDVIEVGDELTIDAVGKYFKYGDNTIDAKERNAALGYREEMYGYIDNIKDRDTGRQKQDTLVPAARPARHVRRRGLPGYRR